MKIKTSDVVFRDDLYPRIDKDPALVQRYAEDLESLPPIEVNQHNELIDGWHRWTAYKSKKIGEIEVKVTRTKSDVEFLSLACRRNATAGKQLSAQDKRLMAVRLYNGGAGLSKSEIQDILSVSSRTVASSLEQIDADLKEQRERTMISMWLSCHTQEEIAVAVGVDQDTVSAFLQKIREIANLPKSVKSAISHDDLTPEIYSVWNFGKSTNAVKHFGNIPPEILDNLLYYFTSPFDVVFDPFAGGGSTIDVCRKRWRRYFVSDLTPIEERGEDIRKHDIVLGLPGDLPVPDLVFLDPPYWRQAQGKYSKSKKDLSNMDLEAFLQTIGDIAKATKRKWQKRSGKLALIIGPWKDNGKNVDLPFLCYQRIAKYLDPVIRIQVPYSTQVHGGAYVKAAQKKREILYLSRDLMVFENGNAK